MGWQFNGHDSKYPSWAEVNPRLKRPQDAAARESLYWLMAEGRRYHTTVSLYINMFDAYEESPLWKEYLEKDIIAKDLAGNPLKGEVFDAPGATPRIDTQSYQVSYAPEWELGLAQRRIDGLLATMPIQEAGTIHIDAFHSMTPVPHAYPQERYPSRTKEDKGISPYLGYTLEQEAATQRKIYRYFRDRGFDVTSEGTNFLRPDCFHRSAANGLELYVVSANGNFRSQRRKDLRERHVSRSVAGDRSCGTGCTEWGFRSWVPSSKDKDSGNVIETMCCAAPNSRRCG